MRDDSNLRRRQNEPSFVRYVERHYPQSVQVEGMWIDDSDDRRRIRVPEELQREMISGAHGVGHFGCKRTASLLKQV